MKILTIVGAMPNYDSELSKVCAVVNSTLEELGVELENIDLAYENIPFFDGVKSKAVEGIMHQVEKADAIVFATTAMLYSTSSVMSTFLEYFSLSEYEESLRNKNCMLIVTSYSSDERYVLESFSRILHRFGAFDSVRMGLSSLLLKTLATPATTEIIEKQVEDFYRMIRQNRRFFVSSENNYFRPPTVSASIDGLSKTQYETLSQIEKKQKLDINSVYEKLNLNKMTDKQESDVSEISQIFAKKIGEPKQEQPKLDFFVGDEQPQAIKAPPAPRGRTCKQMTQSMPHYFQPQMANGFVANIQLVISGKEKFDGVLQIENTDCQFYDGSIESPDITILADSAVWHDVLVGKVTAHKAFMIGQLKVRGNFVVLSKLEQLFKPMT